MSSDQDRSSAAAWVVAVLAAVVLSAGAAGIWYFWQVTVAERELREVETRMFAEERAWRESEDDHAAAERPGGRAQVAVHCRSRSCAQGRGRAG